MSSEDVFAHDISGMGLALSPKGEAIVNARMAKRDSMLDDLERRGVNVGVIAHRHHPGCRHVDECSDGHDDAHSPSSCKDSDDIPVDPQTADSPETPDDSCALIARQKDRIRHLEHLAAVQENKILLLREALASAQSKGEIGC